MNKRLISYFLSFLVLSSFMFTLKAKEISYEKQSITAEFAQQMVNAAANKAKEIGVNQNIAIVDEGGALKAFLRMDGSMHLSISVSQKKAYTALVGMSTKEFFEFIQSDSGLARGVPELEKVIIFGGGFPIKVNGKIIGGIGVSGGTVEEDIQCAKAALALLDKKND